MVIYSRDSTATIVTFNPPMHDPVLFAYAWGIGRALSGGPWTFSTPYEVLHTGDKVAYPDSTTVIETAVPAEAGGSSVFLRFPGIHSTITISSAGATDGGYISWSKYVTSTPTNVAC